MAKASAKRRTGGGRSGARERTGLTRERLVVAGLALAEREGIEAVTLRRLADELGARPMSLYTYIRDKDELLDAMFSELVREIAGQVEGDTWQAQLGSLGRVITRVFTARRNLLPLATRLGDAAPFLPVLASLLAAMRRDGFGPERAVGVFTMVVSYALGVVFFMNMLVTAEGVSPAVQLRVLLARLPPELIPAAALPDGLVDPEAMVAAGLDLLIDSLERERDGARLRPA